MSGMAVSFGPGVCPACERAARVPDSPLYTLGCKACEARAMSIIAKHVGDEPDDRDRYDRIANGAA